MQLSHMITIKLVNRKLMTHVEGHDLPLPHNRRYIVRPLDEICL